MQRVLAQLSPKLQDALFLFDIEGHTHQEIAVMLGLTVEVVWQRVARARQAFRERYLRAQEEEVRPRAMGQAKEKP